MPRDLGSHDIWDEALERSRTRRAERRRQQRLAAQRRRRRALVMGAATSSVAAFAIALSNVLRGNGPSGEEVAAANPVTASATLGRSGEERPFAHEVSRVVMKTGRAGAAEVRERREEAARRREQRVLRAAEKRRAAVYRRAKRRAEKKQAKTRLVARRTTKRRAKGGGVTALQSKLGLDSDGAFGSRTERALKRWQKRNGLTPDGVVGPQTRVELGLGRGRVLKRKGAGRRQSTRRRSGGGNSGGGNTSGVVGRVIAAANRIATKPYRYGGGHGSFEDSGYDCSGSVSYALRGGGLLDAPLASGGFMSWGAPGPGKHITIYATPGHMYMVINGRRFDTNLGEDGSRWDNERRSTAGYTVRHPPGY